METILIVDDMPNYHLILETLFKHQGYETVSAFSGHEAWDIVMERDIDLVLTDMTMPDGDGLELLTKIREKKPELPVVMLTAFGTVELAVETMKLGAFYFLTKTCSNEEMLNTVNKALEGNRLSRQNKELQSALTQRYSFGNLIGKSKPMLNLYQLMEKVAPTKANVLITGESGTGKELVAQALHYNSQRAEGPFVAVNCAALSATLLESELFGHEKGAFTDAKQSRPGRFELADGGTLFLDEAGEMDPSLQVKLLRVLQERQVDRVGSGRPISIDVRLVAATNRDLKKEVAAGRFRKDLFYRLNVVHLALPPLRDRLEDLPLLIEHFLKKHAADSGGKVISLNKEALRLMFAYNWPGNVRELENVIERGLVLSVGSEIMPEELPDDIRYQEVRSEAAPVYAPDVSNGRIPTARQIEAVNNYRPISSFPEPAERPEDIASWVSKALILLPLGWPLDKAVSALEEGLIRAALKASDGVQSHAASALGLKKNVFKYKWDKYVDQETEPLAEALALAVPRDVSLVEALEVFEEAMLREALNKTNWVQSHAADILGIKKNLMQYKLKKFNLKSQE